jgi:predicted dehydrogenase
MLRVGVIGCGQIAQGAYLPTLNQPRRGVRLQAVCDLVPELAERGQADSSARAVYTDYHRMLREADLDLVVILTQVMHHASIARDCLKAGKHVYTEKPLAPTYQEAKSLLNLAKRKGLLLTAAPLLMVYPQQQFLRKTIREGAIGKVCFVRAHSSHGGPETFPGYTDSGNYYREEFTGKIPPIYDMAVYALNTLTAVLGPVKRVSAMSGTAIAERRIDKVQIPGFQPYTIKPKVHDNCLMLLEWAGACFGVVDGSFCMRYTKGPGIEFYGSEGTLYTSRGGGDLELISTVPGFNRPADWHTLRAPGVRRGPREPWGSALGRHLAHCLKTGEQPLFGGEHAVHVVEVMEAIFNSAQAGETIKIRSTFQ